jgi:hypothetical protein
VRSNKKNAIELAPGCDFSIPGVEIWFGEDPKANAFGAIPKRNQQRDLGG